MLELVDENSLFREERVEVLFKIMKIRSCSVNLVLVQRNCSKHISS